MDTKQILITEICPTTTQAWIKNGALLVDVREKDEVAQLAYDAPNIVNIPLSEFEIRYIELPVDKELVMVCRSGGRSMRAAGFLINHGYDATKVANMKHGIIRWVQRGFATKGAVSSVAVAGTKDGCWGASPESTKTTSCGNAYKREDSHCC